MSLLTQFMGTSSGGASLLLQRIILSSTTFVAPLKGNYLFAAIGGGGSGAKGNYNNSATGGAAGGLAMKVVPLEAGASVSIVVGAGGLPVVGVTITAANGLSGGQTTVTGPGIALTANGGLGGLISSATTGTLAPQSGGTASGGDMNVTGGSPDGIILSPTVLSTGGAAVGIYGFTPQNTNVNSGPTGGGSVLGTAGAAFAAVGQLRFGNMWSAHARYHSGAGRWLVGPRPATYFLPTDSGFGSEFLGGNLLCPVGLGGTSAYTNSEADMHFSNGQAGAGGGVIGLNATQNIKCGGGGMYAGGSSVIYGSCSYGRDGGILGGGGGAIAGGSHDGGYMGSGPGGVGGVIVQFLGV